MSTGAKNPRSGNNSLTIGLALIAGLGLVFMVSSAGIGVIQGEAANNDALGLLFMGGIALLIGGSIAWAGAVRPWETFDDINIPKDAEPHHDTHHETSAIEATH